MYIWKYFILSIPLAFYALWNFSNTTITDGDGAAYLDYALYVSSAFEQGNYFEFIERFFAFRGWRPNIYHYFYIPTLTLTGQNLFVATLLSSYFFIILSTTFLYKIFRIFLKEIDSALCAAICASSCSVLFGGWDYPLFAEIAYVPFMLGTIYFLYKSNFFTIKKNSYYFALLLFLVFALRPMQGLITLIFPLIFYFIYSINAKKIRRYNIIKSILYVLFSLSFLFFIHIIIFLFEGSSFTIINETGENGIKIFFISAISTFILNIIFYILSLNHNLNENSDINYIKSSFKIFSALFTIFWLPFFPNLYRWIFNAGIGVNVDFIIKTHSILDEFIRIFIDGSLFLYTSVFFLCLLVIALNYRNFFKFDFIKNNNRSIFLILLVLSLFLPLIFYLLTPQDRFRVVSLPMLFVVITGLIIFSAYSNDFFRRFSLSLMLVVYGYGYKNHFITDEEIRDFNWDSNIVIDYIVGTSTPRPINSLPNPNEIIIENVSRISKNNNLTSFAIHSSSMEPISPTYLSLLSKLEKKFFINTIGSSRFIEDLAHLSNYDAIVLVNPVTQNRKFLHTSQRDLLPFNVDHKSLSLLEKNKNNSKFFYNFYKGSIPQPWKNKLNISTKYATYIAYLYTENIITKYGWKELECFNLFNDNTFFQEKACILINIKKK